jgi:hypothetical protein
MANAVQLTEKISTSGTNEETRSKEARTLADHVRGALQTYAEAAADARLLSITGEPVSDEHARFNRKSYRPGAWGDPL